MPKQADAPEAAASGLRVNELRFIKAVFDNMTQKPDADWSAVAVDLGLKDAKCAKERFRQMSVRHGWRSGPQSSPTASPTKSKKGAATRPSGDGKVAKKPRAPRKAAAKKKEEISSEEEVKNETSKDDDATKTAGAKHGHGEGEDTEDELNF